MVDAVSLGTIRYVVARGLFERFLDPNFRGPTWLRVESLDDLKAQL